MLNIPNQFARRFLPCVVVLVLLGACSSGSPGGDGDGGGDPVACGGCPCVGDLEVESPQPSICSIRGTLTENATLPKLSNQRWSIVDSVTVDSAVLIIEPGVEVFANKNSITGDPEYIYIMPGASIQAVGTQSDPIIFSSDDDDYEFDSGVASGDGWVGLVIDTGNAASANRLEYVILAEAGLDASGVSISLNGHNAGLTLLGAQDSTVLNNVQVHDTFGDGIHIDGQGFGSTALLDSILVTGAGRDGIHYDDFSGLIKDALVVHRSGNYSGSLGGRAGIRAGGANSAPLITNVSLVGRDTTSTNNAGTEYGLLVENNADDIRLSNSVVVNFRHGCYFIRDGADLSAVALANAPLGGFIDGVHCVDETSGTADIGDASPGASNLTEIGSGNGSGLRFYDGLAANFEGEDPGTTQGFSGSWRVNSIGSLVNGGNTGDCATQIASHLCLYNDGDTNDDGSVNVTDIDSDQYLGSGADPLFGGLSEPGGLLFYAGPVPIVEPGLTSSVFIDPRTLVALNPQPSPTDFQIGFITELQPAGGFDLTQIGAVKDAELDVFDGWTLQGGAVTPAVTGFDP